MIWFVSLVAALAQPSLEAPRADRNGFSFGLQTAADSIYVLDQAASLSSAWKEQQILNGTGSPVRVTKGVAANTRFFRVREFPRTLSSKPGSPFVAALGSTNNSTAQWSVDGELPEGLAFADGVFTGTPSVEAPETGSAGTYTNIVRLNADGFVTSAEIIHQVRLSYAQNIFVERPNGPSFGSICIKCHGSGFPPNFISSAAPLINTKAGSGGACPPTWSYLVPGDPENSLIYRKLVSPPCGDRMPQGGPYFNDIQIERVARWISQLEPGETD